VAVSAEALLESLEDWWALAGVEVPPRPVMAPAPAAPATPATPIARARPQAVAPVADALTEARRAAAAASTLAELEAAVREFEGCPLKAQARSTVFMDGVVGAPVLIIGEAPGKDEDEQGKPFVGRSGQLLDRMLATIGLSRTVNCAITNVVPWRPPGNRTPTAAEIAVCLPFARRHLELARPSLVILVGGVAAQAMLDTKDGITKLRKASHRLSLGATGETVPTFATLHPAYLLRRPGEKRFAWADLLRVEQHLLSKGVALEPHF
jgi:DNA polymerase